ncbi:MAG: glycosyltransferase family 2 protein [Candidatus Hermodarchaeia archaeon]|jgi:glycosyltransferase involved in cell wall biosynthesis
MIAIITVNWNAYDFLALMIESLEIYTRVPYKLIVIDNSEHYQETRRENVLQFKMAANFGHGRGLNHGVAKAYELFAHYPYIMFLDVDCHILCHNWEPPFLAEMEKYDLIGGRGVASKPIRPACMFMKQELGKYNWADTTAYKGHRYTPEGFDVAVRAYYQIVSDGFPVGFLEPQKNRYGTVNGEEWCINGVPLVYHHWHGAHLKERSVDFPNTDLFADKAKLFSKIPWRLP